MKKKNTALFKSAVALLLCFSMLVGTTFAWFTDNVTSTGNIITSGTLDVELYWTDDLDRNVWYNVEDAGYNTIFSYDNWEPGYTDVRYLKIVNKGNLALNYKLAITPQNEVGKLAEAINVYFANEAVDIQSREDLSQLGAIGLLNNVLNGAATASGTLLAENQQSPLHPSGEIVMTMAMTMITSAGNEYQGEASGDFTITALATQAVFEQDSFGSDYDNGAEYPAIIAGGSVSVPVTPVDGKVPAGGVTLTGNGISAYAPEGTAMVAGADRLTLSVTPMEHTTTDITVVNNEILIPVDVHVTGIAEGNTVPIVVDLGEVLPKYLNMGNYHLYHVENGANSVMTMVDSEAELTAHNTFTYDPLTGKVKVAMASFSEVALVADTTKAWKGEFNYDWYNADATELTIANADQLAAFGQIVGGMADGIERDSFEGKTIKLLSDINMGDKEGEGNDSFVFYPIGYYNNKGEPNRPTNAVGLDGVESTVYSFEGIFDGNGHKVANIYQNTWEMFGDYNSGYSGTPNYYKDAMGLFGYVNGGTIKNLTVDNFSSDGEFTPTGVIAAYADGDANFENIAITNCNPRVYNTGNGGIVGIAGDTRATNDDHITLKNITVDNSNKISALWGSWDVACGGLVGMYRGNVNDNGDATGDTIDFENCHVAAQIDVYNDVCANYQYYAYRYAGMIIGSVRHNKTENGKTLPDMTGISASACTVNYGKWNEYYYCEFEKNSMASYSEDYQFSRVDKSEIIFENGKAVGCTHNHTEAENHRAIFLPFYQLFTGYSWGVSSIGLKDYSGIVTNLGITEGENSESVEKFDIQTGAPTIYRPGQTIVVGDLFKELTNAAIGVVNSSVYVSVSPATENDKVSGTYNANTTDWTKGTITFADDCVGSAKIIITDYYFCKVAVLVLDCDGATEKFTAKQNVTADAYATVKLGDLFSATKSLVGEISATFTDSQGNVISVSGDANNWAEQSVVLPRDGVWTVSIKDGDGEYCIATTLEINVNKVDAFEAKLKGDFLYRVGNTNSVKWTSLFSAENDVQNIGMDVINIKGDAAGTYTDGTVKFTGTGVVKVTISADGANAISAQFEVVNATNVEENGKISNYGVSSVLLGNTTVSTLYLNGGATLYGNGFTIDCTNAPITGTGNVSENYVIALAGANLDNVKAVGKVYTEYGAMASSNYNRALVLSTGNSTITNCYLSNTASPIRINSGNLTVTGSTVKGGNFANIDIRSGHLTLDNVTTINQERGNDKATDGSSVIGLGIVVYYETVNASGTSITVKNSLTQYNHISNQNEFGNEYAKKFVNAMFTSSFKALQYESNGIKWVNTGIILMTSGINVTSAVAKTDINIMGASGAAYTVAPTENSINSTPAEYVTLGQGLLKPAVTFDHDNAAKGNYIPKEADKNDYCYFDGEKILVSMDQGDTFQYDPFILNATKLGNALNYTVTCNGSVVTKGSKISFNTAGDYTITYTYEDPYNYRIDKNGELESYTVTYVKTDVASVATVEPKAIHAKFTFATDNTETEEILYNNNTYISAKGVTADGKKWGKITVGDKSIVYPIVEANVDRNTTKKECQAFYYVFRNVLEIEDANGTKYNAQTGTNGKMPSNLQVVKGMELKASDNVYTNYNDSNLSRTGGKIFCYSSSGQEDSPVAYNGYLAYKSPPDLSYNGSRNYDAAVIAQYQFTDSNNATYYYYVGYTIKNPANGTSGDGADSSGGSCIAPETLITLADGTQKRIDEVSFNDTLLVWDFFKGEYAVVPAALIVNHGYGDQTIIKLVFEDGTVVKAITAHSYFDADTGKWELIDATNAHEYLGHAFVQADGNGYTTVKLVDVDIYQEYTESYSLVSAVHYNFITENMFSLTNAVHNMLAGLVVDEGMTYNLDSDIKDHGKYTYADFADYITYAQYVAFNGDYLKISVEKGYISFEEILALIEEYL